MFEYNNWTDNSMVSDQLNYDVLYMFKTNNKDNKTICVKFDCIQQPNLVLTLYMYLLDENVLISTTC